MGRISHKNKTIIGITLDRNLLKAVDQARNPQTVSTAQPQDLNKIKAKTQNITV